MHFLVNHPRHPLNIRAYPISFPDDNENPYVNIFRPRPRDENFELVTPPPERGSPDVPRSSPRHSTPQPKTALASQLQEKCNTMFRQH